MAKKDRFKQMQEGGGALGSFQDLVRSATTVAAIEQQAEQQHQQSAAQSAPTEQEQVGVGESTSPTPYEQPRFMRLPNPQIPLREYNLVSQYCNSLANMTRQDFVELAIITQLHTLGQMPDEEFNARRSEIRNRPPRGQRKGTRTVRSKSSSSSSDSSNT